jgi:hypothetical protein
MLQENNINSSGKCLSYESARGFIQFLQTNNGAVHDCASQTLGKELSLKITAKVILNYTKTFNPYRAVNTLRLGYNNQSVNAVYGNNRCLF